MILAFRPLSGKLKNTSLSVLRGSAVKITNPFRVTIKPPFLGVVVDSQPVIFTKPKGPYQDLVVSPSSRKVYAIERKISGSRAFQSPIQTLRLGNSLVKSERLIDSLVSSDNNILQRSCH
jgi:hypothetical protein